MEAGYDFGKRLPPTNTVGWLKALQVKPKSKIMGDPLEELILIGSICYKKYRYVK